MAGYVDGNFCRFSDPIVLQNHSVLYIAHEDGFDKIPVLHAGLCESTMNTKDGVGPLVIPAHDDVSSFEIPTEIAMEDDILVSDEALVFAADGSWRPEVRQWSIGVICRTNGKAWMYRGVTDKFDTFNCGDRKPCPAVIEALAVCSMLEIGQCEGWRSRGKKQVAAGKGTSLAFPQLWSAFGKHLVVITDRPALIGNLLSMVTDKRVYQPCVVPSRSKTAYQVMTEMVMYCIATACNQFVRVSIVNRSVLKTEPEWLGKKWPPHSLACAAFVDANITESELDMDRTRGVNYDLRLRSYQVTNTVYEHVTFSFDWDC